MSIELDSPGTEPSPVHVTWMHGVPRRVDVAHGACGFHLSIEDVLVLCSYVLTNSDLDPDDERLKFVEAVKEMKVVEGWNKGGRRLEHPATFTYFYRKSGDAVTRSAERLIRMMNDPSSGEKMTKLISETLEGNIQLVAELVRKGIIKKPRPFSKAEKRKMRAMYPGLCGRRRKGRKS